MDVITDLGVDLLEEGGEVSVLETAREEPAAKACESHATKLFRVAPLHTTPSVAGSSTSSNVFARNGATADTAAISNSSGTAPAAKPTHCSDQPSLSSRRESKWPSRPTRTPRSPPWPRQGTRTRTPPRPRPTHRPPRLFLPRLSAASIGVSPDDVRAPQPPRVRPPRLVAKHHRAPSCRFCAELRR
uniref:Uncharacterized protein n=1 Tax=Arundo donax TaxID=35708 RepID=A0A0A9CEG2_ARUDO